MEKESTRYIIKRQQDNTTLIKILLPQIGKELNVFIPVFDESFFDLIQVNENHGGE